MNNRNRIYDRKESGFHCLIPWRDRGEKAALTGKATGLWYDREMLVSWVIHALSHRTASILDCVNFFAKKRENTGITIVFYLFVPQNDVLVHDWLRSVYLGRERIMPMTRKVHRESVTGRGARAVGEVNTITITTPVTVEITWELPLQIQFLVSIQQRLSIHLGPECQMEPEDLQWVEGNQSLSISHDFGITTVFSFGYNRCACKFMLGWGSKSSVYVVDGRGFRKCCPSCSSFGSYGSLLFCW